MSRSLWSDGQNGRVCARLLEIHRLLENPRAKAVTRTLTNRSPHTY